VVYEELLEIIYYCFIRIRLIFIQDPLDQEQKSHEPGGKYATGYHLFLSNIKYFYNLKFKIKVLLVKLTKNLK
jgi:hypothetical protein